MLGKLEDTYFAAGSEAYTAALLVYQYAKTAKGWRITVIPAGMPESSAMDGNSKVAKSSNKAVIPAWTAGIQIAVMPPSRQ